VTAWQLNFNVGPWRAE